MFARARTPGIFVSVLFAVATLLMSTISAHAADATPKDTDAATPARELVEKFDKELKSLIEDVGGKSQNLLTSDDHRTGFPEIVVWASAKQWGWTFKHHDLRDPSGQARVLPNTKVHSNETPPLSALVFPHGSIAHVQITSDDIIHPFNVPKLDVNKDAVPGRLEQVVINTSKMGVFSSVCGAICGEYEDDMAFTVYIVDTTTFAKWSANLKAHKN